MVQLRDYQEAMIDGAREAMKRSRRVLLQAPTGAGKTALASYMAGESGKRGRMSNFICHRAELITQTSKTFRRFDIAHGFIAAGIHMDLQRMVQVCSIDTLKNRVHVLPEPKLAIWDECHHMGAAGWQRVMAAWPNAFHIGLSATPWRLDGSGLDAHFDELVMGPTVGWLIEQGHLSRYRIFAPPPPVELRARGANDGTGEQAKVLDKPKLIGDVVTHWRKHALGMRTVGFACNVQHSLHMVEAFKAAGIPAAHLDGDTPKAERERIIKQFAAGEIQVLWNVSLFGEGFDLSAIADMDVTIDCVILNRKTQSLSLFLQMVGRVLRPAPGKVAVILDHGGNVQVHGFPDDEREWSLTGREKGTKAANDNAPPPPITCDGCFAQIRRPAPPCCPECGKALIAPTKEIIVADIPLVEITPEEKAAIRKQRAWEEQQCKDLNDWVTLGRKRGYSFPMQWALKRFGLRKRGCNSRAA